MRWALLLLLLTSTAVAGSWKAVLAPGPVGASHDRWLGDCDSCHLSFEGVPDGKCLACHEVLAGRIAAGDGFHAAQTEPCIACHTDHHGLDASLTRPEALAGFDHGSTGFALDGVHGRVDCATCHDGPQAEVTGTCGSCHDDPHSSARGPECQACHVPVAWDHQLKTLSAHLVATDGGHEGLGCDDCHTHGANLDGPVICNDCHADAHGGTTSACDDCHEVSGFTPAEFDHGPCTCAFPGKHQTVGCLDCHADFVFTDTPVTCEGCHTADRPHEDLGACAACHDAVSWSDNRFDHNRSAAFPVDGAHTAVSCVQCHTEPGTFRGAPTACAGCHQAAGDAAHGDFGACEGCHTTGEGGSSGFRPSTFDHATTGFPLTGQHTELPCQTCHAEKVQGFPEAAP